MLATLLLIHVKQISKWQSLSYIKFQTNFSTGFRANSNNCQKVFLELPKGNASVNSSTNETLIGIISDLELNLDKQIAFVGDRASKKCMF